MVDVVALVVEVSVRLADGGQHQRIAGELVGLVHLGDGALKETIGVVRLSLFVELLGIWFFRSCDRGRGEPVAEGRHESEVK
ncbi:MAG TPA: hypothetical protein ENJ18_03450 [Nannocystis exedens]|nr:hypothetical protein [Nannocystis exedens]